MKRATRPNKNDHAAKNPEERRQYAAFLRASGGKGLTDTDLTIKSNDEFPNELSETTKVAQKITSTKRNNLPRKRPPYKSGLTQAREYLNQANFSLALSAISVTLVTLAVGTVWSLNREVGVLDEKVTELQNKYSAVESTNGAGQLDTAELKGQILTDLQDLKDRVNRLEIKVFR